MKDIWVKSQSILFKNCIIVDDITEPCKIKNCTRRIEEYLKEYCKNQMKMEENEMIPGTFVNDEMPKYDPIVSKYYGKKLEELTKDFQKRRDEVISQSALGKAASNYISTMEKLNQIVIMKASRVWFHQSS